jgi:hypothetical protein
VAREKRTRPVTIFISWHRDEAFWKDIYKNVLTAVVVGAIFFCLAIVAGYVKLHRDRMYLIGRSFSLSLSGWQSSSRLAHFSEARQCTIEGCAAHAEDGTHLGDGLTGSAQDAGLIDLGSVEQLGASNLATACTGSFSGRCRSFQE